MSHQINILSIEIVNKPIQQYPDSTWTSL